MKSLVSKSFLAVLLSLTAYSAAIAGIDENHRLYGLRGDWKFQLGDNPHWAEANFNDNKWDEIYVPSRWEEEGYPGYDGYAWYRKHFDASESWRSKDLLLEVGMIDDVDEVYVNGQSVGGTGSFPPDYATAYNVERRYSLAFSLLNPDGDNVIAVRVYDGGGFGGITDGPVGIYERWYSINPDLTLPSIWKFKTGDDIQWKEAGYDDSDWKSVYVPAYWETQGYQDYDGYAWYRVNFNVSAEYRDETLIMLVGKIDDFDEVYLNGQRIGGIGPMPKYKMTQPNSDAYEQMRAYLIPSGLLRFDKGNVLAVRVYDCWQGGGIYDGPIGIVTRQHYLKDKHWYRHVENWFYNLFDDIFN